MTTNIDNLFIINLRDRKSISYGTALLRNRYRCDKDKTPCLESVLISIIATVYGNSIIIPGYTAEILVFN